MPFYPNLPQPGQATYANVMRAQLNSLNDEIAAIPAGPLSPQGVPGDTPGQVLTVGRIDGMIATTWAHNTALQPNPTADGTYPIATLLGTPIP